MILEVVINDANAVSSAVKTALNAKKAEVVAGLVSGGMSSADADAEADVIMAPLKKLVTYVYYQNTKCVLKFNTESTGVEVIGDDYMEPELNFDPSV